MEGYEYTEIPAWWKGGQLTSKMKKLEAEGWELDELTAKSYVFKRKVMDDGNRQEANNDKG